MTEPTNDFPFCDSFRFLDQNGFEHLIRVQARTWPEMLSHLAEMSADILQTGGKGLISSGLRVTLEEPATVPPAEPDKTERYVEPEELEDGLHWFVVKEVYRDTGKNGNSEKFKVVLVDQSYEHGNGNWGITCFKPEEHWPDFKGWRGWPEGKRFKPETRLKVLVRDPEPGGKWAEIVGFKPA